MTKPDPVSLSVENLPTSDVFEDMARVHRDHRPAIRAGKVMRVRVGGKSARVVARGSRANKRDVIAIDMETRRMLGVRPGETYEFRFSPASLLDEWRWAWTATDATARVAARLALVSLILGGLGVILGALGVIVAVID